jgi:hypothetical protein
MVPTFGGLANIDPIANSNSFEKHLHYGLRLKLVDLLQKQNGRPFKFSPPSCKMTNSKRYTSIEFFPKFSKMGSGVRTDGAPNAVFPPF